MPRKNRNLRRNSRRNSINRRGGAIRLPSEYFGIDSGRYGADMNAGRTPHAYGYTHAQSMGNEIPGNQVGPNMHAHPDATGIQTGGKAVMPGEYYGNDSGRYTANTDALCPNAYGKTIAQSMGNDLPGNQVGANMHAHPNPTGLQTGGYTSCGGNHNEDEHRKIQTGGYTSCGGNHDEDPRKRGGGRRRRISSNSKSRRKRNSSSSRSRTNKSRKNCPKHKSKRGCPKSRKRNSRKHR